MKKMILFLACIVITIMLSGCVSNKYRIEMNPLYESDTEVYFKLDLFYRNETKEYTYNIAKFDKDTLVLSLVDYDTPLDSSEISNYTEYDAFAYKRSDYHYEGTLNNPIFYNDNTEQFFDIRDNQIIELDDLCLNTSDKNSTCNILGNGIQVAIDSNFEINISNYVLQENLSTYLVAEYSGQTNLYTSMTSYSNYSSNKIGIKIDVNNVDPFTKEYTAGNYIESIILEYDLHTNILEKLFIGPEYRSFDFVESDNSYIFRGDNVLYTYDIESSLLNSANNTHNADYLGSGFWFDESANLDYLFKYNALLEQQNRIDYNFIIRNDNPYIWTNPLIFNDGFMFEKEGAYDGFKSTFNTYRIANLDTKRVLYEVSKYNTELVDYIVTYSRTE